MLLNIAKAYSYEMLQFGENKAYAHNEVISVLLRHAQRHSGKLLFWMLSLELHEKTLSKFQVSSLLNSTAQVQKKKNFASKINLNKYQQNNIDKSSDREAT